jgi:phospholipid/cholesterol/gamma-HCH transport system substrate-binding protein
MESKRKPGFAEVKVGIFVLLTCLVLAVAIFTIGRQVGLLEETFVAKTYLNTVAGLKPGDIVLLGGVEVGNVTGVLISKPSEIPPTELNQRHLRSIAENTESALRLEQGIPPLQTARDQMQNELSQARMDPGTRPAQLEKLEKRLEVANSTLRAAERALKRARDDADKARANLQNIVVYLQIKSDYRGWIRRDSNISLGSVGLLGDKYIEISLGRTAEPPAVVREETGRWLGSSHREVVLITGVKQAGFGELITGANDILANFEVLSEQLQSIMGRFDEGEGSVGKFFSDPSFYNNLNSAVMDARQAVQQASLLMSDITRGPGAVPRLIQERELYDRINDATERLQTVMARLEQGEGTLGKFINDPSLYQHSDRVMDNVEKITGRMESGQGTLGKLSTDERLYEDLRDSLKQISGFMQGVEQGKGTLGKLAKDEQLYQNMNQLSTEVVKLIYDFRQNPRKFLTIKFEIF